MHIYIYILPYRSNDDVIIKMPLIEHNDHQNIINKDNIMSNTVNSLNVSNSNLFLVLDSLHFPLPSNINMLVLVI